MRHNNVARPFAQIHLAKSSQDEEIEINYILLLNEVSLRKGENYTFEKGQLIRWKPNLKNRNFPEYGEPVIITSVLKEAVFDPSETSAASPYFREPLTLVVGRIADGDFLEYHVDGRRFEPFLTVDSNL
jgi:hypothetical protein